MHIPTSTLAALLATLVLASSASAAPAPSYANSDGAPVVDLGKNGKWKGTVQNNGTVHSWKGASPRLALPASPRLAR